jgi:hypothetical protein
MTIAADTTGLHENAQRVLATGIGVADDDNYRRLDDNYEPRQMDITNLATTGRSSCRRPAILVDVDQRRARLAHASSTSSRRRSTRRCSRPSARSLPT